MNNLNSSDLVIMIAAGVFIGGATLELVFGTLALILSGEDDEE